MSYLLIMKNIFTFDFAVIDVDLLKYLFRWSMSSVIIVHPLISFYVYNNYVLNTGCNDPANH